MKYIYIDTQMYTCMHACMNSWDRKMKPTNPYRVKKNIIQERTLLWMIGSTLGTTNIIRFVQWMWRQYA